jgi:DNA-binding CsgD family transcriptional regulator
VNNRTADRKAEAEGPSSFVHNSLPFFQKRRSRRKPHIPWEQAERESGGRYTAYLNEIAHRYPDLLSPTELKVCALIKDMKPSWVIAEMLGVCEDTIENHRVNIRRKIGLTPGQALHSCLIKI